MSRDEGKFWVRQFTIHDMKVRPANSAGQYPHQDLSGARRRCDHFAFAKGGPRFFKNHCAHGIGIQSNELARARRIVFSVSLDAAPKAW